MDGEEDQLVGWYQRPINGAYLPLFILVWSLGLGNEPRWRMELSPAPSIGAPLPLYTPNSDPWVLRMKTNVTVIAQKR